MSQTSVYCSLGIIIFFVLLVVVPPLLTPNKFEVTLDTVEVPILHMDLNQELPIISSHLGMEGMTIFKIMKGKTSIILNFWATWCPPCLEELPSLEYLNRQLKVKPSSYPLIASVSVDERKEDVDQLLRTLDFQPSFFIFHDPGAKISTKLGTSRFPETYWIDANGNILHKWVGPQNWLSAEIVRTLSGTISLSSSVK